MFLGYDLTRRRHEFGAELAAPGAVFESLPLPSCPLNWRNVPPRFVVARTVAMMHGIEDPKLRLARGIENFQHVGNAVVGVSDRFDAGPDLAALGNEIVVRIDHQKRSDALVGRNAAERARVEAEAANQAKSTFLATMSHEIRTPMNGVLGMVEVLERQGLNDAQRKTVSTIRDSGKTLLHIIDDILDFSKIEAGRLELEAIPFSLSGLVTATLETFRPQVVAKGLTLDAEIDAGSQDALVGDPTRVRQILFNLLSNAIKFTERGGVRVRVGTAALGEGNTRATHEVALRQYGFWAECGSSAISAHCTDRRGHYGCNVS